MNMYFSENKGNQNIWTESVNIVYKTIAHAYEHMFKQHAHQQ